jgi:succinate-acetate transporter protein
MAVGNTFGATALSSYGGFWIAYGILLTPNWNILGKGGPYDATALAAAGGDPKMANSAVGFFLTGWFIFTTILLLCTLRSTVMFFLLFFTLDLAFLMLACGEYATNNGAAKSAVMCTKAGGGFGMLAAFLAWYNAFAGIADSRSVYFLAHILSCFLHIATAFSWNCSPERSQVVPMEAVLGVGDLRSVRAAKCCGGVSHLVTGGPFLPHFGYPHFSGLFLQRAFPKIIARPEI